MTRLISGLFLKRIRKACVYGALIMGVLVPVSCGDHRSVEVGDVRLKGVEGLGGGTVDLILAVEVHNPNDHKIKVVSSDVDLFISDKAVGEASLKEKVVLPAGSKKTHTVKVASSYKKMLESAGPAFAEMLNQGSLRLGVKGSVKGKAYGIFGYSHEVDYEKNISVDPGVLKKRGG